MPRFQRAWKGTDSCPSWENCSVGKAEDTSPEVEGAHRASIPRCTPGEPPRPILIRLQRWSDKQENLTARKKGQLIWEGHRFIFQDFPAKVQRQRSGFWNIKKMLQKAGLQYGMVYPAKLCATLADVQQCIYTSPMEAAEDFKKLEWYAFFSFFFSYEHQTICILTPMGKEALHLNNFSH